MIAQCPGCAKRYKLEEKHFQGRDRITVKCPSCQTLMPVERERADPAAEVKPETQKLQKVTATSSGISVPDAHLLAMPPGKRLSLAVLQGPNQGGIFPISRPVTVIGRTDSDVCLDDGEVSRRHAQIEVKGSTIILRDLKSTNGTYMNEQHVVAQELEPNSEFRVGSTTLMLIVTEELA